MGQCICHSSIPKKQDGKFTQHFPSFAVIISFRFGYSSSGALAVEGFQPLIDAPSSVPLAPAYRLKCSARKLESKDVAGKSGIKYGPTKI